MNAKDVSVVAWPGRVPVPSRVFAHAPGAVEVRRGLLIAATGADVVPVAVSPELYLRDVRELDTGDEAAVVQFVARFGVPQIAAPVDAGSADALLHGLLHEQSAHKHEHRIERAGLDEVAASLSRKVRGGVVVGSQASVRLAVDWLYDLTTSAVEQEWSRLASGPSVWRSSWIARPMDRRAALRLLSGGLNAALRPFHARVLLRERAEDAAPRFGRVGVFEVAALQLFDDIAAGFEYRACGSQSCPGRRWPSDPPAERIGGAGVGRVFVRQLGGGRRERYKTEGVRFCSRACARAELQREYRAGKGRRG